MRIQDFEFTPKCPQESIDAAIEWAKENESSFGKRANWALFENGKKTFGAVDEVCHNKINLIASHGRDCIVNENATKRRFGDTPPEGLKEFLDWFTKDSMFSRFILNKDESVNGCFVFSSDIPHPLLHNMNIISRSFWEVGPFGFKAFKEMLDAGYSGDVAYGICINSNMSQHPNGGSVAKEFNPDTDVLYDYSNHRAWGWWYSLKSFRNFLTGEMGDAFKKHCEPKTWFRNHASIYGGAAYCDNVHTSTGFIGELLTSSLHTECKERLSDYRKGTDTPAKIVNPFARPNFTQKVRSPVNVTYKELMEVILPYMKEVGLLSV